MGSCALGSLIGRTTQSKSKPSAAGYAAATLHHLNSMPWCLPCRRVPLPGPGLPRHARSGSHAAQASRLALGMQVSWCMAALTLHTWHHCRRAQLMPNPAPRVAASVIYVEFNLLSRW